MIAIKFFTHPMIPPDDERAELKFQENIAHFITEEACMHYMNHQNVVKIYESFMAFKNRSSNEWDLSPYVNT